MGVYNPPKLRRLDLIPTIKFIFAVWPFVVLPPFTSESCFLLFVPLPPRSAKARKNFGHPSPSQAPASMDPKVKVRCLWPQKARAVGIRGGAWSAGCLLGRSVGRSGNFVGSVDRLVCAVVVLVS